MGKEKGEFGKCFLKNEVVIFCEQLSKGKEEHTSSLGETGAFGRGVGGRRVNTFSAFKQGKPQGFVHLLFV